MKRIKDMTRKEYWEFRNKVISIFWRVFFVIAAITAICVYCWMDEKENPFQFTYRVVHDFFDPPEVVEERVWDQMEVNRLSVTTKDNWGKTLELYHGYVPAKLLATDSDGNILNEASGELRVRNVVTAVGLKAPYEFKADEAVSLMGMGAAGDWCLRANCFDPTLLRNIAAVQLGSQLEIPGNPEQRMTEMWIDGIYVGCYLVSEPLENMADRLGLDTANGDFAVSYELFKLQLGTAFITADNGLRFAIASPASPDDSEKESVTSALNDMIRVLESGDYEAVKACVDTDSFARAYVLNELFRSPQYNESGTYYFRKDGVFYAAASWDYELSCGNNLAPHLNDTEGLYVSDDQFYPMLTAYPEFKREVSAVYEMIRPKIRMLYEDDGFLDTLGNSHTEVFDRNYSDAGWVVWGKYLVTEKEPEATYGENLIYLRNWLKARDEWLAGALILQ